MNTYEDCDNLEVVTDEETGMVMFKNKCECNFTEITIKPVGVFSVLTGKGSFGSALAQHPDVDKVAFTGSTYIGQVLRRATAGTGKKLSLELGGKIPCYYFRRC